MTEAPVKYCDLVMKGGITSGVVYPKVVLELAKEFRFKNIGGTSAGAIAAAASAAAAMGDRSKFAGLSIAYTAEKVGFEGLAGVAAELSSAGVISSLFQPVSGARTAYRLIETLAGNAGKARKFLWLIYGAIGIAPIEFIIILAAFLAIGYAAAGHSGLAATFLPSFFCAYLGAAVCAILRVARVMRRNLLGLCSGISRPRRFSWRKPKLALTEWLHTVLQELSGKEMHEPLTFSDLWAAKPYKGEPKTKTSVNLQMITTGVSHREPRTVPFSDAQFWFRREEFDLLFPKPVVDWMITRTGSSETVRGRTYYKLPSEGDLPVLVGMRMSLSFPLLISAVPLHEPASRERRRKSEEVNTQQQGTLESDVAKSTEALSTAGEKPSTTITEFRICWFSDGGISSNFPIHLFDAPLPLWPTFAINLLYPKTSEADQPPQKPAAEVTNEDIEASIFLPTENNQGWQRTYQSFAKTLAAQEIVGFLFGIIATMQNWRDTLQSRAPGYRDRIVHISLSSEEGGMNLNMPQPVLTNISKRGSAAGRRLKTFSFNNHYWIRWRNVASAIERWTIHIADNDRCLPKILDYQAAYDLPKKPADAPSYKFGSTAKRQRAEKLFDGLIAEGNDWKDDPDANLTDGAPRPLPQMTISPTY